MTHPWQYPHVKPVNYLQEGHLGGTAVEGDPDSWFPELWDWLVKEFEVESVLDVGCGCGYAQRFFQNLNCETMGLDGSPLVLSHHLLLDRTVCHDFTADGAWVSFQPYDLVWCCELAEHVDAGYVQNVIDTVALNARKAVAFCAAPPNAGGHHHVNCQPPEYWIEKFEAAGLTYFPESSLYCRELVRGAAYGRGNYSYFTRSGLIFKV